MKTAISIPDALFEEAETTARELGMTRSELYRTALAEYLQRRRGVRVTEALDAVYGEECSEIDPELLALQIASLPDDTW